MTDRELLELAAKAAGYVLVWGDKYQLGDDEIDCTDIPYVRSGQPDEGDVHWNPITDDGDALRLVVQCRLIFASIDDGKTQAQAAWSDASGAIHTEPAEDKYAATRRAIVRAAAEIGRNMP